MANIKINRGTTFTIDVEYTKGGVAETLAGATILFTVKTAEFDANATDSSAVVSKDVTVHTDEEAGLSLITINPADTAAMLPGKYFYDIKVTEAGGAVYKIDEGTITIDGSPTNRLV